MRGLTDDITRHFNEQLQQIQSTMDRQFSYMQDQFTANLNCRFKHHQSELLKEVTEILPPIAQHVSEFQSDVWRCSQNLKGLVGDMSSMKHQSLRLSALADASVQTSPVEEEMVSQRQRLQSTMHDGPTRSVTSSPKDSPIPGECGGRFIGNCPFKLEFPTFSRMENNLYPQLYLEKCKDFLALNMLIDGELMVTLRTVLYGTARDWWDVARMNVHSCTDFQSHFLSVFLSEDYEDELVERVHTRIPSEDENRLCLHVPFLMPSLETGHFRESCLKTHPEKH